MEYFSRQRVLVLQFDLLPNSSLTCLARFFGIVCFIVPLWYIYIKNQLTEATLSASKFCSWNHFNTDVGQRKVEMLGHKWQKT